MEIETKTNDPRLKLCIECGENNKFNMRTNKKNEIVCSGKRCIKCCSSKNNKNKTYYRQYYLDHMDEFKNRDKERYKRLKESKKNIVEFNNITTTPEPI
jgi:hypothetical protein